jgi:hypothetical protein
MILIKNEDGSYTESGENTLLTNIIDGIKAPLLKENEYLPASAAFWGTVAYSVGSAAASSVYARKRQAAGQPPMLKVFF